jgi:hypothetical protein
MWRLRGPEEAKPYVDRHESNAKCRMQNAKLKNEAFGGGFFNFAFCILHFALASGSRI